MVGGRGTTVVFLGDVPIALRFGAEVDVAADVEVEFAVAIVVEEDGAGVELAGFEAGDAGFFCDVGESAVAVVVIQDVGAELRDVEIGEAVVVVVAPDAAEAVVCAGDACGVGDIGEGAVGVVAIESVFDGDVAVVAITAVDEVDVLPAVVVEVGDADAGAEFFEIDGDAVVTFEVGEVDAGAVRDVSELGWGSRGRSLRRSGNRDK